MNTKVILPDYRLVNIKIPSKISFSQLQNMMNPYIRVPYVQYSYMDICEGDWIDVIDEDDWQIALSSTEDSEDLENMLTIRIRRIHKRREINVQPLRIISSVHMWAKVIPIINSSEESGPYNLKSNVVPSERMLKTRNFNDMFDDVLKRHGVVQDK